MKCVFEAGDYETLIECPWCSARVAKDSEPWCKDSNGFRTVQCPACAVVFVQVRLNAQGRQKYYRNYYSQVHQAQSDLVKKRLDMYRLERDFIGRHVSRGRVLDIGCGGGEFLEFFDAKDWERWGVEFGEEAAEKARKKIGDTILQGDLLELGGALAGKEFDLVTLRGVIEHVPSPKLYLEAAMKMLKPKGKLFIGSTPNRDSICADLFRGKWIQHVPETHIYHFSCSDFKAFFYRRGLRVVEEASYYLETPYANLEKDLALMGKALVAKSQGTEIDFVSPPFLGSMMTLIFEKVEA